MLIQGWGNLCTTHTGFSLFIESALVLTHVFPYFWLAFSCKLCDSPKIRKRPKLRTVRRYVESIGFVRVLASMIAVDIHLQSVFPSACCRISMTSIAVRHSWQLGVATLVIRSYRLLQSVVRSALGSSFSEISGYCHANFGLWITPHMQRIQLSLWTDDDIE